MSTCDKLVTVITEDKVVVDVQAVVQGVAASGGTVDSVFGRMGTIVAANGDYTKAQVGLGNVDNTADTAKPVSTPQQTAIDAIKTRDYYVTPGDWDDLVYAWESGLYKSPYVPNGTYTCTDNEATPLAVHANVLRITSESRDGVIIDANCGTNNLIQDFITAGVDCVIENLTIKNFGNGAYAHVLGTVNATGTKATKIINCALTDLKYSAANGFENCTLHNCIGINQYAVTGNGGWGYFARNCYGIYGCSTAYWQMLAFSGYDAHGNYAYRGTWGLRGVTCASGNRIQSATYGMRECHNIGFDNDVSSCVTPFQSCIFNHTYMDNTDNTKKVTDDISHITTATTRNHKRLDNDGFLALFESAITPVNIGDLAIETTSDTALTFKFKGSDGVIRSATVTLA